MSATRSGTDLGWGTVSYLEWMPDSADLHHTVLLLHGGGIDNAELSWGEVGPVLAAAGHRVVAPDHPGYGRSLPAPWPHTQQRLVGYVGEFADALGLDRYSVGGLSMGGGMAIGHVLAAPGRIRRAMLLASYGLMCRIGGPLRQLVSWAAVRSGLSVAANGWLAGHPVALARTMNPLIRDPARRTPSLIAAVTAAARRPGAFDPFAQFQHDEVGITRLRTDYTDRLSEFAVPVLIVQGDRDPGVPLARARAAAELLPDARLLVLPGAGHGVQRDRPAEVHAALIELLRPTV